MRGTLLSRVLDIGVKNIGIGGFLQHNENIRKDAVTAKWMIGDNVIDPEKSYRVCFSEFLLTGGEANLDFLSPKNPEIIFIPEPTDGTAKIRGDIRAVVFEYLKGK